MSLPRRAPPGIGRTDRPPVDARGRTEREKPRRHTELARPENASGDGGKAREGGASRRFDSSSENCVELGAKTSRKSEIGRAERAEEPCARRERVAYHWNPPTTGRNQTRRKNEINKTLSRSVVIRVYLFSIIFFFTFCTYFPRSSRLSQDARASRRIGSIGNR